MMKISFDDELIAATLHWCRRRLTDMRDAEELAQDILCEALTAMRRDNEIRADLHEEYVSRVMSMAFYPLEYVMHYGQHAPTLAISADSNHSAAGTVIYYR